MEISDPLITEIVDAFGIDEPSVRHLISVARFDVFANSSIWQPDPQKVIEAHDTGCIQEIIECARVFARRQQLLRELLKYVNQ